MSYMDFQGPTFTMEVPTDWFVSASPQFQAIFTSPVKEQGLQANLVVSIRPLQDGVTAKDVTQSADETRYKEYPQYEVITENDKEDSSFRLYRWHNPEHDVTVVQHQAMFVQNNRLYSLTGTRPDDITDADAIDQLFEHMIRSFHVKEE